MIATLKSNNPNTQVFSIDFQLYLGYLGTMLWDSGSYLIFFVVGSHHVSCGVQVQVGADI
jgi:hypothetical protein